MTPKHKSDRVILEANLDYWNPQRFPKLQRIVYDNTLSRKEALELIKTSEGRVDLVTRVNPLKTLPMAQSEFAKVIKNRDALRMIFGLFNIRKAESPWRDVRVRRAVNLAINRKHFIQYATRGNGIITPALLPPGSFGYDPTLKPYAFDQSQARDLLRDAGYADGLSVHLVAGRSRKVQATVISKMLEQIGLNVEIEWVGRKEFQRHAFLGGYRSDLAPDKREWDIVLAGTNDLLNFPVYFPYHLFVFDGEIDWVDEEPPLRELYTQVLSTVDPDKQQALLRQMERHVYEYAHFLFLYSPIPLYAVNKEVNFVPHKTDILNLAETSVTDQHWSVRPEQSTGKK